jgi:hypothetical protein
MSGLAGKVMVECCMDSHGSDADRMLVSCVLLGGGVTTEASNLMEKQGEMLE